MTYQITPGAYDTGLYVGSRNFDPATQSYQPIQQASEGTVVPRGVPTFEEALETIYNKKEQLYPEIKQFLSTERGKYYNNLFDAFCTELVHFIQAKNTTG